MGSMAITKTGPAHRYSRGKLIEGYLEITSEYIGFRPLNDSAEIGFLQWHEFKNIRTVKQSTRHKRPPAIHLTRTGGNSPLVICVQDSDAWVELITAAYELHVQSRQVHALFRA